MMGSRRGALSSTVDTIKRDINDICQTGNYYVTEEIGNEFNNIANGLDHLKLDGYLMNTSADWQKGFDSAQVTAHNSNAKNVLDSLAATLYDYRSKMGNTSIQACQENEIRERHNWALNSLRNVEQDMTPFTHGAADRVRQFGDHIGVTDRYTGYRNNLTRGTRDPFKLGTSWMDKSIQGGQLRSSFARSNTFAAPSMAEARTMAAPGSAKVRFGTTQPGKVDVRGYQTVDSLYPRSNTMFVDDAASRSQALANLKAANALNASTSNSQAFTAMPRGHKNLSVQEQAGINTTYPGRTEYMTRYKKPPQDVKTSDFIVNPTPNFMLHGRPLGLTTYSPSFTEYQTRYEWPDGNKIVKLPWRRN
ncbi:uncharacterized protein LOC132715990 [Ruditapes philippinarum]|uniref:uncharacterized protein LOC132715990 n=1 Tax=Ruditapes philippinarum TaxID=129788 RepID=UPI00295B7142|nr:uncharacterized protein LOC132715990 [Ruditapes philippinarum]